MYAARTLKSVRCRSTLAGGGVGLARHAPSRPPLLPLLPLVGVRKHARKIHKEWLKEVDDASGSRDSKVRRTPAISAQSGSARAAWFFCSAPSPRAVGLLSPPPRRAQIYGSKPEHYAWIGWKNHKHSVNNPYSQFRDEYTEKEVRDAAMIYEPLTKLHLTSLQESPDPDVKG